MNVLVKVTRKALRMPVRLFEHLDLLRKESLCQLGIGAVLHPLSRIDNLPHRRDAIIIGRECLIYGQLTVFAHGGSIRMGDHCFLGENSRIWSTESISIGDRVLLSHDVNVHDSDSHSLSAMARAIHFKAITEDGHPSQLTDVRSAPVVIEDDVWIGFGAAILKGVTIGKGAVVGACSVVTKNVDPFTVVAGNPARVIGQSRP